MKILTANTSDPVIKSIQMDIRHEYTTREQYLNQHNKMIFGSQLFWMVTRRYTITNSEAQEMDRQLLNAVHYDGRDLGHFLTKWKKMIMNLTFPPNPEEMECHAHGKHSYQLRPRATLPRKEA